MFDFDCCLAKLNANELVDLHNEEKQQQKPNHTLSHQLKYPLCPMGTLLKYQDEIKGKRGKYKINKYQITKNNAKLTNIKQNKETKTNTSKQNRDWI